MPREILSTTDDFKRFLRSPVWKDLEGALLDQEEYCFNRLLDSEDFGRSRELAGTIKAYRSIRQFIELAARSEAEQPVSEFDSLRKLIMENQL